MLRQTKNGGSLGSGISTLALETTHAIMEAVGQSMHRSFSPGHHFAIKPDKTVTIRHGHFYFSLIRITANPFLPDDPHLF